MKKRAAAYCRVSTDKEDQLNSLSVQEEYFSRYVIENGYELVRIYADEGITGTKRRNRKEFNRMLEDAVAGKFDVLFVKDISRFARNTVDSLESLRLLKQHNVGIVFINNQGILETSSELMFTIMSAMAQEESVNMSKRVKFGKAQNAKKGKVPNIVYGYDKINGDYYRLDINEREAKVVKRIFRMYVEDGYGCLAIAKCLNQDGLRTKRGCYWSQNAISRILKNEIYIGKVVNAKEATKEIYSSERLKNDPSQWIIVENPELRIIDNETYEHAQQLLQGRFDCFHMNRERQSNRHLFSTLIKCKHCGWSYRRIERHEGNWHYIRWQCSSRNRDGRNACDNTTMIKEDELLDAIIHYLAGWLEQKEDILEEAREEYKKALEQDLDDVHLKHVRNSMEQAKKKIEKLKDLYMNDLITMEELKEQRGLLKRSIEESEDMLRMAYELGSEEEIIGNMSLMSADIHAVLNAITMDNQMLKRILEKIVVDKDGNVDVVLKKIKG